MAPFYGWGPNASRLQPLRGDSLLFTIQISCMFYSFCASFSWNSMPRSVAQPFNCLKATDTSRRVYFLQFRFPVCFTLFVLLSPETPCLVVGAQPCMEWIPIRKKYLKYTWGILQVIWHIFEVSFKYTWSILQIYFRSMLPVYFKYT